MIIFVLIGTLLTVIVQSGSAAGVTLSLCGGTNGLSFELAAAIILGENIGTTITANIALVEIFMRKEPLSPIFSSMFLA